MRDLWPKQIRAVLLGVALPGVCLLSACGGPTGDPGSQGGPGDSGTASTSQGGPGGSDAAATGGVLAETEHVSANGGYRTSFEIPVPPGPGAPRLSLNYDSQANGSLAGIGWDLSVGFPISIIRDVRFGTPEWKFDANWLWGSAPLIRLNPKICNTKCDYRVAPEALITVTIDLTPAEFVESGPAPTSQERATVRLPNGTKLDYEPIYYDGINYPSGPAGAETSVFAFRLSSATDRNGYKTCFKYWEPQNPPSQEDQEQLARQHDEGAISPLVDIAYAPSLPTLRSKTCSEIFADEHWSTVWNRAHFQYRSQRQDGFFGTWSLRHGALVRFDSLLEQISTYARSDTPEDEYFLDYEGQTTETHLPRLAKVSHKVRRKDENGQITEQVRIERTFGYGRRSLQFGTAEIVDLGPSGTFPSSLAGSVSRPMRRVNPINNSLGWDQIGQDLLWNDAAPDAHATTEQWTFSDINGDGLPDLQWGKEAGFSNRQWRTFEAGLTDKVDIDEIVDSDPAAHRPAQQLILINNGVTGPQLATAPLLINSRANANNDSLEYAYIPVSATAIATGTTPWIWGEGQGRTRTGMPVTISSPEITAATPKCPPDTGQDTRLWPSYPDGTFGVIEGKSSISPLQFAPLDPGAGTYIGNPAVGVIEAIYNGYFPTYAMSSTVSGWVDINGDGVPEFVATPAWIEAFSIEGDCKASLTGLLSMGARKPIAASIGHVADSDWHSSAANFASNETTSERIELNRIPGPLALGPEMSAGQERWSAGMPLSYDSSTGNSQSFGVTLPIGSLAAAGVSSIFSGWQGLAAAAPGLTVETFSPRPTAGYSVSLRAPSADGLLQGGINLARTAGTGKGVGGAIADFIMSVVKVNLDVTLLGSTTRNRSETRAQLMDINADGLPDYLLYNTGDEITLDKQGTKAPRGSLLAFVQGQDGKFGFPVIINEGGANDRLTYPTVPPNPDDIDDKIEQVRVLTRSLSSYPIRSACESIGGLVGCLAQVEILWQIIPLTQQILDAAAPYISASNEAIPCAAGEFCERRAIGEIGKLNDALKVAAGPKMTPPVGALLFTVPPVSGFYELSIRAAADTMAKTLGLLGRLLHQIAQQQRVNLISRGFSKMEGGLIQSDTVGFSAQTRGFIDLNGDGLPDYVITNDNENMCPDPAHQWEVFWGTGTSSISAKRAFLPFDPVHSCITVPSPPQRLVDASGFNFQTLPLNADGVCRLGGASAQDVYTMVDTYVTMIDFNRDGRPDIVMAGEDNPDWHNCDMAHTVQVSTETAEEQRKKRERTWRVFLNNGFGFEAQSLDVVSPTFATQSNITSSHEQVAGLRDGLDVPFPTIRISRSVVDRRLGATKARDRTDTVATFLDIDGDGVPEAVRRVQNSDNDGRDALLVWRRPNIGGPQDLMIEERDPLTGHRIVIEYKPATHFQWTDAKPDGKPPLLGHRSLAGVPSQLVRSVTTERLMGRVHQRTRRGFDYKLPYFDMVTRSWTGFATRSSFALDPTPDGPSSAEPIEQSVAFLQRNAQRPNLLPSLTHTRVSIRATGAPVRETLTSYAEFAPTTACPGVGSFANDSTSTCPALGGLESQFSGPSCIFQVEYPSGIKTGPILDLSFDGREPWRDAVRGRGPEMPATTCQEFTTFLTNAPAPQEATGGAVRFAAGAMPVQCSAPFVVQYQSPYKLGPDGVPASIQETTLEAWIKPDTPATDEIVAEQTGAFRLLIVYVGGSYHWRFEVGANVSVTSTGPNDFFPGQWQHLVTSFGPTGVKISVNGSIIGETSSSAAPVPTGAFLVGCGNSTGGTTLRCFDGALGEFRVYAEYWPAATRVTDTETELTLPLCKYDGGMDNACPPEFGHPHIVMSRNDLATQDDDIATQYEYAMRDTGASTASSPIYGLVSSIAKWVPNSNGSPGQYLSFRMHWYDGLAFGTVSHGNETQVRQFDGMPQAQQPTTNELIVKTTTAYDTSCPGRVAASTDPMDVVTTTNWDLTCTFPLGVTNGLGLVSRTRYYGVEDDLPLPLEISRSGPYGTFVLNGRYGQ